MRPRTDAFLQVQLSQRKMLLIQMVLSASLPEVAARSYLLAEVVCMSMCAFGSVSISRAGANWPSGWCELAPGISLMWIRKFPWCTQSGRSSAGTSTSECSHGTAGAGGQPSEAKAPCTEEHLPGKWKELMSCEFTPLLLCISFLTLRGWLDRCVSLLVNDDTHLFWKLPVMLYTGLDYHCLSPWLSGVRFTEAQMLPENSKTIELPHTFYALLRFDVSLKNAMPFSISFWTESPFVMSWYCGCFFLFFF